MIVPNKVISLDESALSRTGAILRRREEANPISLKKLYEETASSFESIDQFLLALDILYVLERIDLDPTGRMVIYAA